MLRFIGDARRIIQADCFVIFLALFLFVCWPYDVRHHAQARAAREVIDAEAFLALDPLVGLSTAIAARTWVWPLAWAGVLLAVSLVVPRGFCAYICPFGTLLDLVHWAAGKRVKRLHVRRRGWWVHLRYSLLAGILAAAACGVLLSGFVAAIPVFTRGMMYLVAPMQLGLAKGWYLIPPMHAGHYLSIGLFVLTIALGMLGARFWCRHLCPSGAIFSVASLLRLTERRVMSACIGCGKCARACPFDAIKPDFTTRPLDCTFCQTCAKACPVNAIEFGWRSVPRPASRVPIQDGDAGRSVLLARGTRHAARDPEVPMSRRGFAAGLAGGLAAAVGVRQLRGAPPDHPPLRPPGSVPEGEFLKLCVRCAQCLKACPYNALQPMGFEGGFDSLWTPRLVPDWVGCEPKCNNCGQVCPTGAIRALPLDEKRAARIGLAIVNEATCLPHLGTAACERCHKECAAAGYDAIEFVRVRVELDENNQPVEGSGFSAPVVLADKCNGCGLCQTGCYHEHVKAGRMAESAIVVIAGPGNEDRLTRGSYIALREAERRQREEERKKLQPKGTGDGYLPDFLK
ncbi:MAG: 4Fe-4S dicluster domain-containing protein [Planctomycetes bacterium]|nr:4Fe-4S dicluster domain-containing protein [Planctomycetota bacterium]